MFMGFLMKYLFKIFLSLDLSKSVKESELESIGCSSCSLVLFVTVSSKVLFSCEPKKVPYPISDLLFSSSLESLSVMDLRRVILNR